MGALLRVPRVFYHVLRWVTPALLLGIFGWWFVEAIANDTLAPTPRLQYSVVDLPQFAGTFAGGRARPVPPPAPGQPELSAGRIREAITAKVNQRQRDLFGWAEGEILPDGSLHLTGLQGDPYLLEVLDPSGFERLLALEGFHYEPSAAEREAGTASAPRRVHLQFEAFHRAPYLWLMRVIMIGITLTFLVIIHAVWRKRSAERAAAATTAPEAAT